MECLDFKTKRIPTCYAFSITLNRKQNGRRAKGNGGGEGETLRSGLGIHWIISNPNPYTTKKTNVLGGRTRAPPDPPHLRGGAAALPHPPLMSASGLPIYQFFNKILIKKPIIGEAGGRL